jgi:hypothetical protein
MPFKSADLGNRPARPSAFSSRLPGGSPSNAAFRSALRAHCSEDRIAAGAWRADAQFPPWALAPLQPSGFGREAWSGLLQESVPRGCCRSAPDGRPGARYESGDFNFQWIDLTLHNFLSEENHRIAYSLILHMARPSVFGQMYPVF